MKTLRDLVTTQAKTDTDLKGAARGDGPLANPNVHPIEAQMTARMPGDLVATHPLHSENPFPVNNPQAVLRALRSGNLSPEQERQARSALDAYGKLSGDPVGGPRKP